jgi:hypothetical protein
MTGKVIDNNAAGFLVLILPFAFGIVLLYQAWPYLLLLLGLSIIGKIWDNYQWQKWCYQVNPCFNQLIKDNRGYLTPMDLSLKANMTGRAAKRFLDRKAEEYGAQRKLHEGSPIYYFITSSALGSIFDDSEPPSAEDEDEESDTPPSKTASTLAGSAGNAIAQLAEIKEARQQSHPTSSQSPSNTLEAPEGQALIQAELAKRLDINPSTVGRRKSDPDFPEWSQSKDPDGIAWKYDPQTKLFVPAT